MFRNSLLNPSSRNRLWKTRFSVFRRVYVFELVDFGIEGNAKNGCSEDQLKARGIPRIGAAWQNRRRYVPEKNRAAEEREGASLLERRRGPPA
jgi:hypothetical protein